MKCTLNIALVVGKSERCAGMAPDHITPIIRAKSAG